MSDFRRPPGVSNDPELCYRSGFLHGASSVLDALKGKIAAEDYVKLQQWIQIDVSQWRYDQNAPPIPPAVQVT